MPFVLLVILRLFAAGFFLATFGYAVLNCSPFAFDMFIRPQLFPLLTAFVSWHHIWFAIAWVAAVASLRDQLDWRHERNGLRRSAHYLAIAYVVGLGMAASWLIAFPFLPTLWNDSRALPAALLSLLPPIWLAAIDHLDSLPAALARTRGLRPRAERHVAVACAAAAVILWTTHAAHSLLRFEQGAALGWLVTSAWALLLVSAVFAALHAGWSLVSGAAALTRHPWMAEYGLTLVLFAAGLALFFERIVFSTLSLTMSDARTAAAAAGIAIAAVWSGLALGSAAGGREPAALPALTLFSRSRHLRPLQTVLVLIAVPVAAAAALTAVEQADWDFVGQRAIVLIEFTFVFGTVLRLTAGAGGRGASRRLAWSPLAALAGVVAFPPAVGFVAAHSGQAALTPAVAFERYAMREAAFAFLSDGLVSRPGFDADYHRFLQLNADFSGTASISVPEIDLLAAAQPATIATTARPDIFVFVVDSLRRDYLSAYNPAVTFTPGIGAFAAENFTFQNAFTRHGGTELAIPSIWAGAHVVRRVRSQAFARMNAMEKLINSNGYRVAINDFTVAEHLRDHTPVTTIDPGVPSVDTDLCRNIESLEAHLDASSRDARPVFGYFAPMNVHILNTRRGNQESLDGDYPGFYAPYASRLKRIDACFAGFVSYLKGRGRYDNSIIVLTSDHGDSLGENGYWGHAMWLFPEDVRVPLVIHVPAALRPRLTTDLARLTFSTDIAPTLYALLGHRVRDDLGRLFGQPLFVPTDRTLPDRRRDAFLLTSSYGATYGLVRRNGRLLYVSDLVEWREFAYDLSHGSLGKSLVVDRGLRRLNQQGIRQQVTEVAEFYRFSR